MRRWEWRLNSTLKTFASVRIGICRPVKREDQNITDINIDNGLLTAYEANEPEFRQY